MGASFTGLSVISHISSYKLCNINFRTLIFILLSQINLSEMFHIPRAFHLMQPKHLQSVTRMISHALGPGPPGLKRYPEGLIQINPEVAEALVRRKPVIALESTVIAHGMPYPENLRYSGNVNAKLKGIFLWFLECEWLGWVF